MTLNDLGKFLVEDCNKLSISSFLHATRKQLKEAMLNSEIQVSGYYIDLVATKVGGGGLRYWWKCPMCHERKGVLFSHPSTNVLGCRKCLNLGYRKSRYKNMIESHVYS